MHRPHSTLIAVFVALSFACPAFAQNAPSTSTATCNFDDEKQLVVEYLPVSVNLKKAVSTQIPFGKPWAPGGKPITLFTNTPLQVRSTKLPVGAYTMFVIPDGKQWTLIVSKSTEMTGAYDAQQDIVRVPMDSGELPSPESSLFVSFAHVAPGQCNLRVDLDKRGHFAEFMAK
jgi:hypothetical protein